MLRWRRYARQLAPLLRPLRSAILRYEREAGLESSAALLAEVLDTGAAANAGGSAANAAPAAAAGGGPQQEQAQQQAGREEL